MLYSRITSKLVGLSTLVLLTAAGAGGTVIFQDDFAGAGSASNWVGYSGAPALTFAGGTATFNNTSSNWSTHTHVLSGTKPSTFTLDFEIKSMTGTAGVMFCKQGSGSFNGYLLTIGRDAEDRIDLVYVRKITETITGNNVEISMSTVYFGQSLDLKPSNNKFTISKSGTTFNIFVNGAFLSQFTDDSHASGDIALFAVGGASAVFGPITMTDQFTPGTARSTFADSFEGGALHNYWYKLSSGGGGTTNVGNGELTMTNPAGAITWMFVDLPGFNQNEFEVKVNAQHKSGGNNFYGIVLAGEPPQGGGSVPMVSFAITAEKAPNVPSRYVIFSERDGTQILTHGNDAISATEVNAIVVKKKANASSYEFSVNGTDLSVNYGIVDFAITAVGIFAYPDVTIAFDNFYAGPIGGTSITWGRDRQQTIRRASAIKNPNPHFYDLRGRKRYSTATPKQGLRTRAAGVYVNENGREVRIRKNAR